MACRWKVGEEAVSSTFDILGALDALVNVYRIYFSFAKFYETLVVRRGESCCVSFC